MTSVRELRPHYAFVVAVSLGLGVAVHAQMTDVEIVGLDAVALRAELAAGRVTAERVTRAFLARIAALDAAGPELRAVLEVNPDAVAIARALDAARSRRGAMGPLHGLPVLVKGNIDTADRMATSAGSLALARHRAAADAPVVARLRAAGAVVLGKTNLSEWANFRSSGSTSGWSSLGGQTRNPYVLDRNPCGSSSGAAVAVAARLAPLAVGTETDGSIVCPAAVNGVVGIKPALGTVSQHGIVPIATSQDTAGPLARTVADAALLLGVLANPGQGPPPAALLESVAGVRVGVVRDYRGAQRDAAVEAAFAVALRRLEVAGAVLVDPVTVGWSAAVERAELGTLFAEFRGQIDAYLGTVRDGPHTLAELIEFNSSHARDVLPYFGQELLLAARSGGGTGSSDYVAARDVVAAARVALTGLFRGNGLDVLVAPANARAWRTDYAAGDVVGVGSSSIAAVTGFPSIAVPTQLAGDLPLAVAFTALPGAEATLLATAAAFERLRGPFPVPRFLPSVAD